MIPLLSEAYPLETSISANQTYYLGQDVSINLTVKNNLPRALDNLTLLSELAGKCPTWNYAREFNLDPRETVTFEAYKFKVNKWDYGGECIIRTSIFGQNGTLISSKTASFITEGVPKKISVEIEFCLDKSCTKPLTVFRKGETAYITLKTNLLENDFPAILIYPDNSSKVITLPLSIKADIIGSYEIQLNISRVGYLPYKTSKVFAVIEGDVRTVAQIKPNTPQPIEIENTSSGNATLPIEQDNSSQANDSELRNDFPADTYNLSNEVNDTSQVKDEPQGSQSYWVIVLAIIAATVAIYWRTRKSKKK